MSSLLPRKYNNPVVIGLGIVLIVAVIVIVLLVTKSSPKAPPQATHTTPPHNSVEEKETYISDGKPALVLFYGDWCGHSKGMLPDWNAAKTILNEGGQITAIDFEHKRDVVEVANAQKTLENFRGFPDIRFYPEGYSLSGKPIAYSGNRSEESFLKFAYTGGQQA